VGDDRVIVVTRQIEAIAAQYGDGATVLSEEEGSAMEVICYRLGEGGVVASTGAGR